MQHRNLKIPNDEFSFHWTNKHAVIACSWLQRNGILGYIQVIVACLGFGLRQMINHGDLWYSLLTNFTAVLHPKVTRDLAVGFAEQVGWKVPTYEGHVEFIARSVEDL